jgi:hypothetical protein
LPTPKRKVAKAALGVRVDLPCLVLDRSPQRGLAPSLGLFAACGVRPLDPVWGGASLLFA